MKTEKINKLKHLKTLHENLELYYRAIDKFPIMSQGWRTAVWGTNYYMNRLDELLMEIINTQ